MRNERDIHTEFAPIVNDAKLQNPTQAQSYQDLYDAWDIKLKQAEASLATPQ